ncbi:MAG: hypothetical protein DLM52_09210 [Chthoniobacterales bacterium]|nr:MAG: hypothetical protein DLM52_09210 [Chthoniobacterales bacterium]
MAHNLPQLYRFCLVMTGDAGKAQEIFQDTLREAAFQSANDEPPPDRYWFFREARWRCLEVAEKDIQPESHQHQVAEISEQAPAQIAQVEPEHLAAWISAAPEPQRSALALHYLDEFSYREILGITGLKLNELATALAAGRGEFQSWLNTTTPARIK